MKIIKSVLLICVWLFCWITITAFSADLKIRRDIIDSVAYIKDMIFTINWTPSWQRSVFIEWGSGNISLSWDINVWNRLCIGGQCYNTLNADSLWWANNGNIYYNTWNVSIGKSLTVSWTLLANTNLTIWWALTYKWRTTGTQLLVWDPTTFLCPVEAVACVSYCLENATWKVKWIKWMNPNTTYTECKTNEEWDIIHAVIHYR